MELDKARAEPERTMIAWCVYVGDKHGWVAPFVTHDAKPHVEALAASTGEAIGLAACRVARLALYGCEEEELCRQPSVVETSHPPLCVAVGHLPELNQRFGLYVLTADQANAMRLHDWPVEGEA